jgi:lysophospholipase L1-like esterase
MYRRYVAIGDSQTEGLWDGDDETGLTGFADRLAARLDELFPGLHYANLAVRGRRVRDVLDVQLPQALEMAPDLITVCAGMNDTTRPGRGFEQALADLEVLYDRLAETGATVVTTTFPDVTRLLPIGRALARRLGRINTVIRSAAHTHGFGLVDLYTAPSMLDPRTWSDDRMHASPRGHALFAEAAAEALGLPGAGHDWAAPLDAHGGPPDLSGRVLAQWQWTRSMFLPWAWNHLRGRSSGDGRHPRRPSLAPVRRSTSV